MKLTDNEIAFFKNIGRTEVGSAFASYLEHVISHICDVRNFEKSDSPESVKKAADIIQSLIIDKIRLQNKPVKSRLNENE